MKNRSKKDIIKNIAIVFLGIMLVLTFFSNTILNWSLPQVSGKYTEYGEIKTGVRGSGTVVSNMTYTESVRGLRTVEAVYVSRGAQVNAGDLLMLFSATDAEGIEALEAEIATMQEAYDRALLGKTETDYSADEMAIRNAEEDLAELKAERGAYSDSYVADTRKAAEDAAKALEAAEALVESLEEELEEISESSDDPAILEARKAVEEAQERYDIAVEAYEKAKKALDNTSYTDTSGLESQRNALTDSLIALERELDYIKEDNQDLLDIAADHSIKSSALERAKRDYESAKKAYDKDTSTLPDEEKDTYKKLKAAEEARDAAQSAYNEALAVYNANLTKIKEVNREIDAKNAEIASVEGEIYYIRNQIVNANTDNREHNNYKSTVEIKQAAMDSEKENLDAKTKALDDLVARLNKATSDKLKAARKDVERCTEEKGEADAKLAGLSAIETLDEQIKSSERSLESMKLSLERQKENDERASALAQYDLNKQLNTINAKKSELAQLKSESKEGYEMRATHAGVVTEVNFKAGEIASDGSAAVVVEVQDSGYTLSFSVSNTEATKVKIGDTAAVSDTYWGQNVGAVLENIIPDAGGRTKTLVFELDGNVNVGQTLTLLVGERSTGYSSVIPKTALREDSKGKFIYITKTKSTPLGNRYVATRLDVNIAAEDDKNVAISTDESYIYEYVIVSSTKPFEEGDYVRLSE